ncbi:MAG: FAD-dependent thymidylate synthase [Candidatus Hodarchaeota archaeon]
MKEELKKELKRLLEEPSVVSTDFYTIADMKVTMSDWSVNPYKVMFNMATKTWGQETDKWSLASPELRFEVVKMVLERKALPLALEHPKFAFQVDHISRAAFDQLARARIGIVFASKGQKDDNLHNVGFVIPLKFKEELTKNTIKRHILTSKYMYDSLIKFGYPNWSARSVLSMYTEHSFIFSANFLAIQNMLGKRLETTEMEDVVAFSILVREQIRLRFPLLADYLRPASEWRGKDMTAAFNGFSDIIGVPHTSDNRHPGYDNKKYSAKWQEPCTDMREVEKTIKVKLPKPGEWMNYTWETLEEQDRTLFEDGKGR